LNGSTLSSSILHLEGWAQDEDSGLQSAQFIANFGNGWQTVGSPFSSSLFEMDWDLCASGVPDGPVSVALKLRDKAGSQTADLVGLKHFTKNFTCAPPPPACTPGLNQVALFASSDYGGVCTVLDVGSYNNAAALGSLGGDNAASILVDANVQATLYTLDNLTGRSETFRQNDPNLAENRVGANTVSSVLVQSRTSSPAGPEVQPAAPELAEPSAPAASLPLPFSDNMENGTNGWVNGGNWNQVDVPDASKSWRYGTSAENYNNGARNSGSLTSPSLAIPPLDGGFYYLRFLYLYETEGTGLHWDQRRVQISQDSGAFTDVLQLAYDEPNLWLQSPAIDLKPYAGHTIQIRFLFDTVDATLNGYKGWYIDDVSITATPPPVCPDAGEPNDSPTTATAISTNASLSGVICPGGDVDFFKFYGKAGDQIGAWVDAQSAGSKLDPHLFLIAEDGTSVLASNDDQQPSVRSDSSLAYILRRDGLYFLKVRAWDHPSAGGSDYGYTLRLFEENIDPSAHFNGLTGNHLMSGDTVTLSVTAEDAGSGVSHVEFLWHSNDWLSEEWKELGEDWNGSDGWSYPFKLGELPPQTGLALYARAYDWAGNSSGTGVWELGKAAALSYFPVILK
jgi:hypothetical protein